MRRRRRVIYETISRLAHRSADAGVHWVAAAGGGLVGGLTSLMILAGWVWVTPRPVERAFTGSGTSAMIFAGRK